MLTELSIENFAIIERLHVRLEAGFTAITGETGAGKSIIIDALQAALGGRVTAEVVRAEARFAAVEAVFEWPEENELLDLLTDYGVEDDSSLILRREVSANGRGVARLNGRAVPVATLAAVGGLLVDIHGQSDHLSVLRRDRQLMVLDRYADLLPLRQQVAGAVARFSQLRSDLDELARGQRESEQRLDLLRFQVQEIETAALATNEEESLAAERNLLVNAERLATSSRAAHEALQGGNGSALDRLSEALVAARELTAIDGSLASLHDRLQSASYELDDVAQELRKYGDQIEYDPRRLAAVEERLDLLVRLKRKYGASIEEVIEFGARAQRELDGIEHRDERLDELKRQVREAEAEAGRLAQELSTSRDRAAEALGVSMRRALQGLGLKGTGFRAAMSRTADQHGLRIPGTVEGYAYSQSGIDTVSFLVSFNPGEELRPLEKVASGGETSRFLLALKSVLAGADRTPTLVFDEVDVGVGGRHGTVVGERLRALSRNHQVLSITHLPQVAALAGEHLSVTKALAQGRTTVTIRNLGRTERIIELAEMMSGTGSDAARRNAEELLEAAQRAS